MNSPRQDLPAPALRNGVPLVVSCRPDAGVTTVSVWVLRGSRHETVPGITHLLEHVLMQAVPPGRPARVVDELEALGGEANAVTTRDHLVLYARVPSPDALAAAQVLAAGLTSAEFPAELVEAERRVVDEELRLAAADPTDIVHDTFFRAAFAGQPIGRPVGGTPADVAVITPADLAGWARTNVTAAQVAVVASGAVEPRQLAEVLATGPLGALAMGAAAAGEPPPVVGPGRADLALHSDTAAVLLGGPGFALADHRLPAAQVLMELLAGGNSSVLHEEIRSRRGWSYGLWALVTGYRDTGVWRVGLSTSPDRREDVVELAGSLLRDAVRAGFRPEQVAHAGRRVAGLLQLDTESSLEEVLLLGQHRLVGGDPGWTLAGHIAALRRVGVTDVEQCAAAMLDTVVVATAGGDADELPGDARGAEKEEQTWTDTSLAAAGRR